MPCFDLSPTVLDIVVDLRVIEGTKRLDPDLRLTPLCDNGYRPVIKPEGRVAEHGIQEASQDQEAADRDVQESSIRQTRAFLTEYGDRWRQEVFLPLLMIGY